MENKRRWINYDWFKIIVALILLVIFIILQVQGSNMGIGATSTPPVALASTLEATQTASPTPTLPQPSSTAQLSETTLPATTQPPTQTPTLKATPVPTQAPTATAQTVQPTHTVQTTPGDCSKALPTRLAVGMNAKVLEDLNLREEAGMDKAIIYVSLPGFTLEIVGGPVCIPYADELYRWWNVKTGTDQIGWSAEGSSKGLYYFLEPLP
jgi:hypothetical protein